jgi:hypothetical protein
MLSDGEIAPDAALSEGDRAVIVTAVDFLLNRSEPHLPYWLDSSANQPARFREIFGFDRYGDGTATPDSNVNVPVSLILENGAIPLEGYDRLVTLSDPKSAVLSARIVGKSGMYTLTYDTGSKSEGAGAVLKVEKDGSGTVIDQDLSAFFDGLYAKYGPSSSASKTGAATSLSYAEMSFTAEGGGVRAMIVFGSLNLYRTGTYRSDSGQPAGILFSD